MVNRIILFLFFFCSVSNSQSVLLKGKVLQDDVPISNVEVINKQLNNISLTNVLGEFEIPVERENNLAFFKNGYDFQTIIIDEELLESKYLTIRLVKKEQLIEEVVVKKQTTIPIIKVERQYQERKFAIPDGSIQNGVDFVQVFKLLSKIFKKDKPKEAKKEWVSFQTYVNLNFTDAFLLQSLELKETQWNDFLTYCDFDPEKTSIIEQENKMILLDFLIKKAKEFKEKNN